MPRQSYLLLLPALWCHIWSQVLTLGYSLLRLSLPLPSPWCWDSQTLPTLSVPPPEMSETETPLIVLYSAMEVAGRQRGQGHSLCFLSQTWLEHFNPSECTLAALSLGMKFFLSGPSSDPCVLSPTSSLIFLTHRIESRMDTQEVCLESWPWQPTPNCSHPQEGIVLRLLCSHIRPLGAGQAQLQEDYQFPK